ncbi:hypothetical protein M758_N025700 [Ceratodon purpureus]|nr:hypothetical protein M758_N025700 [Ceratodon purpureus]
MAIEITKAPISTSTDTHAIPEPSGSSDLGNNVRTSIQFVSCTVDVTSLANIIHLHRNNKSLVHKWQPTVPLCKASCSFWYKHRESWKHDFLHL